MNTNLTAEQKSWLDQAAASMAIENMPASKEIYDDTAAYFAGEKTEQEVLDGIKARATTRASSPRLFVVS